MKVSNEDFSQMFFWTTLLDDHLGSISTPHAFSKLLNEHNLLKDFRDEKPKGKSFINNII